MSVLQEASERISQIIQTAKRNCKQDDEFENGNNINQNELVRTGEITPFQAEEKNNSDNQSQG